MQLTVQDLEKLSELFVREPEKVYQLFSQHEIIEAEYPIGVQYLARLYIDLADAFKRKDFALHGFTLLESLEVCVPEAGRHLLQFNMANALCAAASAEQLTDGIYDPDGNLFQEALKLYRKVLEGKLVEDEIRYRTLVGLGNVYSIVGRTIEAAEEYKKAIHLNSNGALAWGNLGVELKYYSRFVTAPRAVLEDAQLALTNSLNPEFAEDEKCSHYLDYFQRTLIDVRAILSVLDKHSGHSRERDQLHDTSLSEYYRFCSRYGLYLGLDSVQLGASGQVKDSFHLASELKSSNDFLKASRLLNEICESYATARYLLFSSVRCDEECTAIDTFSEYSDHMDRSCTGIKSGRMKLSFQACYSILDRVAVYLHYWYGLEHKANISFHNVWFEENSKTLHSKMKSSRNQFLNAIYTVSKDFAQGGSYFHLRKVRNKIVHQYFVLHSGRKGWRTSGKDLQNHMLLESFKAETLSLMSVIKYVVVYLYAFIDLELRRSSNRP